MEHAVCNLCGADTPQWVHRNFDHDISRCRTCGLVYAGPERLTREETWSRYSDTYFHGEYLPAMGVRDGVVDLPAFDARFARILGQLAPYRQLGTLLDVGCGAGLFLKSAERAGWTVTGLEVMAAGAEFARTTLGLDVRNSAVEDADLPEGAFDVVTMFEVIEHLSDPKALLRRTLTLLRPGGCVALSTPNVDALSHRALGGRWSVMNPGEHLFYFNETTLSRTLSDAGFVEISFDRHYAGAGRYQTSMPIHAFEPSWRTRLYKLVVDAMSPGMIQRVQARGLADGLQAFARRPSA